MSGSERPDFVSFEVGSAAYYEVRDDMLRAAGAARGACESIIEERR